MFIPIGHENLRGRRWPVVTITIIVLNFLVFLGTYGQIENESKELGQVELHILRLAAVHPGAEMPPAVQEFVQNFQKQHPTVFYQLQLPSRRGLDDWDLQMQEWDNDRASSEMANLAQQFAHLQHDSLLGRYGFIPARPSPISYITSEFLHRGWLHLIFNMWFLWLAGTVLEDAWGRVLYPIVYLFSGAVALIVHSAIFPHSIVPVIGASGAIAGLIGAFLVRFPKTRIKLAFFYWLLLRPRMFKFHVPAYVILPIWLFGQVLWGMAGGSEAGVAYWVHVGGFIIGVAAALVLRATGWEQSADKAIEAKVSWSADPRLVKAGELLAANQADAAIAELQSYLREKPDSLEAHELILRAQEKKQDFEGQKVSLNTLCRLYAQAGELSLAWHSFELLGNLGGEKLPRPVWMELCRYLEGQQNWERAAMEYENVAKTYSSDRASIGALVSAARIQAKKLNHREEALRLYRLADSSPLNHLDWDAAIQAGLKELGAEGQPIAPILR